MKNVITLLTIFFALAIFQAQANDDLETIVTLSGKWKFNLGDDNKWAQSNFNDSDWDVVYAPGSWENQGYVGYNGYAWYRTKFTMQATQKKDKFYIQLGNIDDVNQVYLNGQMIGQIGIFPPHYESAYNAPVLYAIPEKLLNLNGENVIAVRVYDEEGDGGLVSGPMQIGYDSDYDLLSQDLSGKWKLTFKNYKGSLTLDYNDSNWNTVLVPSSWESQGFPDYDGYACYRKVFELEKDIPMDEKLYMIVGKIDDRDRVYLNGKLIGSTQDMYHTDLGNRNNGDWQIRRAYKIPSDLLNKSGKNVIVVLVYDAGGIGGIHAGPVGIMTKVQFEEYVLNHRSDNYFDGYYSFWDFLFNEILN